MTAINDLVDEAGSLGIGASLQALCDVARALEDMLCQDIFRFEFRMPAEPVDVKEAPEAISVNQIDVYALARELEGALRAIVLPERASIAPAAAPAGADVPAVSSVSTVTRELRERLETIEKETISLPVVCSDLYTTRTVPPADRPLASDHLFSDGHTGPKPPMPQEASPAAERRIVEGLVERETLEKSVKKSYVESTEQSIKRSASVVRELEDVYERLASHTIDMDSEIKRSTIVELSNARIQAGAAVPPPAPPEKSAPPGETTPTIPSRSVEVPAFRLKLRAPPPSEQAADNVKRLSEAMARSNGPTMGGIEANGLRAPAEMPDKTPAMHPREATVPAPVVVAPPALVAVHHSFNTMNRYLALAAGMVMGTMGRMPEGGISPPDIRTYGFRAPVERTSHGDMRTIIQADMQAMAPFIAPAPAPVAPPALVAVHHSFNTMNKYVSSAIAMAAGTTGRIAEGGARAPGGQAPLVRLMLDNAAPASAPINTLVRAGESVVVPVPQPVLVEGGGGSPALSLAVNVAAARAAEHSGGQAMMDLARDTGYSPAGREAININLHAATPHVTDNNTNKVSNFHNTFNITVTVKGGGAEESDLRELGKKIGRILSEEIKRYGGI